MCKEITGKYRKKETTEKFPLEKNYFWRCVLKVKKQVT